MECRLCLCSAPAESFVSIHDDPHPPRLVQRIWTCCQLWVRKRDHLPDMICLSCVNNLELLDSFRNACYQNDTTSRVELDKYLRVKPEEVLLEDLIWKDELGGDCSPDDVETPGRKITSSDNVATIIDTNGHILAEELPFRKTLDTMFSTHSELDDNIDFRDKLFTHKNNLMTKKNSDTRRKLHDCDICSKSFNRKDYLNIHMRLHAGVKPYICDICSKTFTTKQIISVHMGIHTGVKPHICYICSKKFIQKHQIIAHMGTHTKVKPYKCDICLKSFHRKWELSVHVVIHTGVKPYKCDICLKTFSKKQSHSAHMCIHTGVKPHKCDICLLNVHLRVHNRVKSYKCDICLKSFLRKWELSAHVVMHTGIRICASTGFWLKGAFCIFCVLFPQPVQRGIQGAFITTPCTKYKYFNECARNHTSSAWHRGSQQDAEHFASTIRDPNKDIICQIDNSNDLINLSEQALREDIVKAANNAVGFSIIAEEIVRTGPNRSCPVRSFTIRYSKLKLH
ncbi:uncharacterized protein LOC143920413 [Arctopsyche grandis]|uniref:uncharacterized protein LOC143920413 n=1 Tax=Arctopsyche grandis TaxID=121162 RepID=UPI00406D87CC